MTRLLFLATLWFTLTVQAQPQNQVLEWSFPIQRPHAGLPMANGTMGVLVWGGGQELNLTIAQQGFWDHQGGYDLKGTYAQMQQILAEEDLNKLRATFGSAAGSFQQLGGGRLQLRLPADWQLHKASLALESGVVTVTALNAGIPQNIVIRMAMGENLAWIQLPPTLQNRCAIRLRPAWQFCGEAMAKRGIAPPDTLAVEGKHWGFIQTLPADPSLLVEVHKSGGCLTIGTSIGKFTHVPTEAPKQDWKAQEKELATWWKDYWATVPRVNLPDPLVQEIVDYGLYMQAICTPPQGVAASLQGPLLEDYQLPPWAADYHWNINEQMIYGPSLATGRAAHMRPLWAMLKTLIPQMQQAGLTFFGTEKAMLLSHATDDRGKVSGSFWAGRLDIGALAWIAQMGWQYYTYTADTTTLRTTIWPIMEGAFAAYQAMLKEETVDGKSRLALPYSVSPEWRGSQLASVGRNASFQLAALHSLCRILPLAANEVGQAPDPAWQDVASKLPPYALVKGPKTQEYPQILHERIGLFDDQDLIESHRHHSHLAGIYPFQTLDPLDTTSEHNRIIGNSLRWWNLKGAGTWTGWCTTWASVLCARAGLSNAAVSWLHYWHLNFVNEGRGTLHDANWRGISTAHKADAEQMVANGKTNSEVMQLDARMGSLTAALELLVQDKPNEVVAMPQHPRGWTDYSFKNITVKGGFTLSGLVRNGQVAEIVVEATRPGTLRLRNNMGNEVYYNDTLKANQPTHWVLKATDPGDYWYMRHPSHPKPFKLVDWNPRKPKRMVYP